MKEEDNWLLKCFFQCFRLMGVIEYLDPLTKKCFDNAIDPHSSHDS
jgi:hypothetical protein